jgi:hypothetical protein
MQKEKMFTAAKSSALPQATETSISGSVKRRGKSPLATNALSKL